MMARRILRRLASALRSVRTPRLHRWLVRTSAPMEATSASALVIAPHADDETFACGGMIALKRRAGARVDIVVVTDGSAAHAGPPCTVAEITADRKREVLTAAAELGVEPDQVHFLDARDGGLQRVSCEHRCQIIAALTQFLRELQPREVYVPHRGDRHADHEATYVLSREAARRSGLAIEVFEYPVWLIWKRPFLRFSRSEFHGGSRLDIRPVANIKARAVTAYDSQLPMLHRAFCNQFAQAHEVFFRRQWALDGEDE